MTATLSNCRRKRFRRFRRISAVPVVSVMLVSRCVFNNPPPAQPVTLDWIGATTTPVSPAPTLRFALSTAVADSAVDFVISPPTAANYSVHLNTTKDTLTLAFSDMLQGNTTYALTLSSSLHSSTGSWLYPYQDTIVFTTGAAEQEPNGTFALADTLASKTIYGMISEPNDTDVFFVPSVPPQATFFVSSVDSRDTFLVFDSLGHNAAIARGTPSLDTFAIPGLAGYPIFVKVFSYVKGTVGMYQFGTVQP